MKCYVCSRILKSPKKKFCSESCCRIWKAESDKKRYRKSHPYRPKRNCLLCGDNFIPRCPEHKCCNAVCRQLLELKKKREIAKENKAARNQELKKPFWRMLSSDKIQSKRAKLHFPVTNSQYQEQIKTFKEMGGSIEILPPQLNGRTPEVNLNNLSGWSVESMFGFGYEIDLLDKLSESADAF